MRATELNLLPAIKIFAAKNVKKITLPAPEWQKAARIAQERSYPDIVAVFKEKGLDVLPSDEKQPLPIKGYEFLDDPEEKDKFSYSDDLLLSEFEFFKSIIGSIDTVSKQQLETIACQGNSRMQLLLAISMGKKKDDEGYRYWLEKSAKGGNVKAQCELGTYLGLFRKTAEDEKEAVEWLQKSAVQGLAKAQYNLGVCYHRGVGVAVNLEQALKWYLKAANQNHNASQNNLGFFYQLGISVEKDERKAMALFRKSAKQGYNVAQYNVGRSYQLGRGVAANYEEAARWYKKAAKQGYSKAQSLLAQYYYAHAPIGKKTFKKPSDGSEKRQKMV